MVYFPLTMAHSWLNSFHWRCLIVCYVEILLIVGSKIEEQQWYTTNNGRLTHINGWWYYKMANQNRMNALFFYFYVLTRGKCKYTCVCVHVPTSWRVRVVISL